MGSTDRGERAFAGSSWTRGTEDHNGELSSNMRLASPGERDVEKAATSREVVSVLCSDLRGTVEAGSSRPKSCIELAHEISGAGTAQNESSPLSSSGSRGEGAGANVDHQDSNASYSVSPDGGNSKGKGGCASSKSPGSCSSASCRKCSGAAGPDTEAADTKSDDTTAASSGGADGKGTGEDADAEAPGTPDDTPADSLGDGDRMGVDGEYNVSPTCEPTACICDEGKRAGSSVNLVSSCPASPESCKGDGTRSPCPIDDASDDAMIGESISVVPIM